MSNFNKPNKKDIIILILKKNLMLVFKNNKE